MADKQKKKQIRFERRKRSVRSNVFGSAERPRLSVFRSDKHIYAQVIDDYAGRTLVAAASTSAEVRGPELKTGGNILLRSGRAAVSWPGQSTGRRGPQGRIKILT
jgi:large subunit ribosomal protein L18